MSGTVNLCGRRMKMIMGNKNKFIMKPNVAKYEQPETGLLKWAKSFQAEKKARV